MLITFSGLVISISLFFFLFKYQLLLFNELPWLLLALLPFLLFTLILFQSKQPLKDISSLTSSIIYPVLPLMSLLFFDDEFNGSLDLKSNFLFAIFVALWLGDSAAYFTGRAIGKRKLFERVSPNKTWEGAIANLLFSIIGFYFSNSLMDLGLTSTQSIVSGVIVGIFGQIGDLFESHLKRDAGVKDSSNILPGHGGFLDRFDSLIFSAPLILIYLLNS